MRGFARTLHQGTPTTLLWLPNCQRFRNMSNWTKSFRSLSFDERSRRNFVTK
ncbi:hypothetical protein TVAG_136070 [Trichomonas vaginalis G3]|uniref:Uncharacterized protein n=1 Tax=Trichomonas vaginalis (strain ATCC PRA-98 / G3) TaxID=412133 RepID=A2DJ89_TRIV3|nr:hypothetical protein TVAGG3_0544030 [Trichomonas vaginalis G3]EAY19476.1 hypothetical protein TVAG_136070 [Trichomonas vaginalis G3]KAI5520045.1 hypothetical protein TVAGG3_0544030 [Trichomonas vaginalis G3]|eukprot:XP_001580462.1 hypothetical protein [Trichomonas vaginalis G3]